MSTVTRTFVFTDTAPVWCSRFYSTKREADKHARWFRSHGGRFVSVNGKRGGPWRVRAKIGVGDYAHFLALEAARECKL